MSEFRRKHVRLGSVWDLQCKTCFFKLQVGLSSTLEETFKFVLKSVKIWPQERRIYRVTDRGRLRSLRHSGGGGVAWGRGVLAGVL